MKVQQSQEEVQRSVRNAELAHQQYFEMKTKYGTALHSDFLTSLMHLAAR